MNFDGMTVAGRWLVAPGMLLLLWGAGVALVNLAIWIYSRTHNGGHHD